jgi:EpsI family protein
MNRQLAASLALGLCMAGAAMLASALTPRQKIADTRARFQLAAMVPIQFGEWEVDNRIIPLQVDPATQAKLDRIYNQTLSRTYINRDGQRVMLSLAYGGDQGDNMGVHKPEICYAAQGFEISASHAASLATPFGGLPVTRLVAVQGARREPITYWITIGNRAVLPGMDQRLLQLKYGLSGTVPDGMLVRVSTSLTIRNTRVGFFEPAEFQPEVSRIVGAGGGDSNPHSADCVSHRSPGTIRAYRSLSL